MADSKLTTPLNFFKGTNQRLNIAEIQPNSFYITTDTKDFYYTDENGELFRFGSNPSNTIKEIHTYYCYREILIDELEFPPQGMYELTEQAPEYTDDLQVYSIDCVVFMDGSYIYINPKELITWDEIDGICGTPIEIFTATKGEF